MNITITSEKKDDHLLIRSVGTVEGKEELFKHAELVYKESLKYDNRKILLDATATQLPLKIFDYYEQVKFFSENLPEKIRLLKIAVVLSPQYEEFGKFWETVSVNMGFRYFAFTSFDKAYNWLLQ